MFRVIGIPRVTLSRIFNRHVVRVRGSGPGNLFWFRRSSGSPTLPVSGRG